MKKTLSLFLLALSLHGAAQNLPNAGFETWEDQFLFSEPDPFISLNSISVAFYNVATTLKSEVSHGGNYAAQLVTDGSELAGYTGGYLSLGYNLVTGADNPYPITGKPDSISFWAIANLEDGDAASFTLTMISQGNPIGMAEGNVTGTSDSYIYYTFPINYMQDAQPDAIQFILTNTNAGDIASTSNILIDDINFIYNTGSGDAFPGGDFEVWADNSFLNPQGYGTSNIFDFPSLPVTQGEPHSGNYSMRIENLYSEIFGSYVGIAVLGGIFSDGCGSDLYSIDGNNYPTGITGYYQYNAGADWDSAGVYLYYTSYDEKLGSCTDIYEMVEYLPATEGWTPFYVHVPESFVTDWANGTNAPEFLTVGFASAAVPLDGFIQGAEGSVLLVDDVQLQFGEILNVHASQEEALKDIYPNPASNKIRLITGKAEIFSAEILDQSGRVLRNLTSNALSEDIDVSTLASGLYFIKVISESGIQTSRFVVEH